MKVGSVETAVNGSVTSETQGIQTFFQIGCFRGLKPQTNRLKKSLLTQHLWLWEMVVMMLILPHIGIQKLHVLSFE
jgi:hypothetical protein